MLEGANHLDLFYGKLANEIVIPLLMRIIEKVWGDWSYDGSGARPAEGSNAFAS